MEELSITVPLLWFEEPTWWVQVALRAEQVVSRGFSVGRARRRLVRRQRWLSRVVAVEPLVDADADQGLVVGPVLGAEARRAARRLAEDVDQVIEQRFRTVDHGAAVEDAPPGGHPGAKTLAGPHGVARAVPLEVALTGLVHRQQLVVDCRLPSPPVFVQHRLNIRLFGSGTEINRGRVGIDAVFMRKWTVK